MNVFQLISTTYIAKNLTKTLSSEIFYGFLRQYLYRKPKIHKKTQNITATLIRRVNYVIMSAPPPVGNQFYAGLTAILKSHNICYLEKEWNITKTITGRMIIVVNSKYPSQEVKCNSAINGYTWNKTIQE